MQPFKTYNGNLCLGALFKTPILVHWTAVFLAYFVWNESAPLPQNLLTVAILLSIILLHELGHLLAMRFNHVHAEELVIFSFGGYVRPTGYTTRFRTAVQFSAGPLVNILLATLPFLLPYLVPKQGAEFLHNPIIHTWIWFNTALAIFNLLPIPGLDGGRMLELLLRILGVGPRKAVLTVAVLGTLSVIGVMFYFQMYLVALLVGTSIYNAFKSPLAFAVRTTN